MHHTFRPDTYWNTLGSHPPVLTVAPGDTVVALTVDAHGVDAAGAAVARGSNPMTGPFFIEGAQPGDTLVVRLLRITPDRAQGWSGSALAANVVEPETLASLPRPRKENGHSAIWEVDMVANEARLVAPEGVQVPPLPLAPMIGCFGVAPAGGEAISTATSGPHGGNMDWRGFAAGVEVHFPVSVAGALFFLGDVHARQGHGEIAGTGIEISAEVEFSVDLLRGKKINWPRSEESEYLCTLGNARPLDQALQHATTEMALWLETDFGLNRRSAHTLMGQVVEYEIANVYDPAYTVVCKMPKRYLTGTATS